MSLDAAAPCHVHVTSNVRSEQRNAFAVLNIHLSLHGEYGVDDKGQLGVQRSCNEIRL